jgi:hypothetical protein
MNNPQVIRRRRSWASATVLASLAAMALGSVASTASAEPIQYTMTWNEVTGSYGDDTFTDETITLKLNYDTSNVSPFSSFYQAVFVNGAGISVTLGTGGSILNDVALDAIAQNNSGLLASSTQVFFGLSNGLNYTGDRGFLVNFTSQPSAADKLTTEWDSLSTGGSISSGWGSSNTALVIGGKTLVLDANQQTNGGSWGSVVVPEPSSLALIGLALAVLAARPHLRKSNRPA